MPLEIAHAHRYNIFMKLLIILSLILAILGCAEVFKPYEVWYIYPHFKVCVTTDIDSKCKGVTYDDGGGFVDNTRKVRACYIKAQKVIYVAPNDQTALLHELCHATGFPADVCNDKYR